MPANGTDRVSDRRRNGWCSLVDSQAAPDEQIGEIMGAGGHDVSPQLSWSGFHTHTADFTVGMFSPDTPTASTTTSPCTRVRTRHARSVLVTTPA